MSTGTVTLGKFVITEESFSIDDLIDVTATTPSSGDCIVYKDNSIDSSFTTGFHSTPLVFDDLSGVDASVRAHNDILVYNDNTIDPTFTSNIVAKNIASVFTELESTVNSIVGVSTSKLRGESGDASITDMTMTSAGVASGDGTTTVSIGSNGNNNCIKKKEVSDSSFLFVQTLGLGETVNLTYPIGTVLRSSKGIYGFSGPLPTPIVPQSFALTESQFYASTAGAVVTIASLGTEISVTLFSGDQVTIQSGPTSILAYETSLFTCSTIGEYYIKATGPCVCSVNESGSKIRLISPMVTEIITWNTSCVVSALTSGTNVSYFRRNGTTGTLSVSPGTQVALGAGSNSNLGINGCVIVKSDAPISTFTDTDSIGTQAISGWPLSQLAQRFCNPLFIDGTASYGTSGIAIGSPYEGSATVYDNTGTSVATFTYSRTNSVVTAADQLYPAAGRWMPNDSGLTELDGGYIETTTPAACIMNFSGDSTWNSSGQEIWIAGTTPEEIQAEIKKDSNGLYRRRDISVVDGSVTWTVC